MPTRRHAGWWFAAMAMAAAAAYLAYQHLATARLDIVTVPEGAAVRIDGRWIGTTPIRRQVLAPGLHRLEVEHSHYRIIDRQVVLAAGERTRLSLALDPGTGTLVIYSNPRGAWVEVDGVRHPGQTPLLLTLPSGEREVVLGMAERRVADRRVVVTADQRQELRVELDMDPHGSLVVDVQPPQATVALPDADVAYHPGVRLPIGEYLVRVSHPGYVTQTVRWQVRYGDNRYGLTLAPAFGVLTVTTDPADARVQVQYAAQANGRTVRRRYEPGMRLPVGEVAVRAAAMGHRSQFKRLQLGESGATVRLALPVMNVTPGSRMRDPLASGGVGPELVVVPPGEFDMGSADGPPSERPVRRVALTEPFAVTVTEITVAQYRRFALATGRELDAHVADAADQLPVTHVTAADAMALARWLSEQSGARYRLLSEPEWEYVARAGSRSAYFFGDDPQRLCRFGNVADQAMRRRLGFDVAECNDGFAGVAPVASFPANPMGVHDILGNVAEWVLECGIPEYAGAPDDGSPTLEVDGCPTRGVRGGSWDGSVADARSAKRNLASSASASRGIRLLREL
ncbi:MAG: SUMF1/EgtB/PvdO family nonheme iron enzyme [Pseudomonadales bacterium]